MGRKNPTTKPGELRSFYTGADKAMLAVRVRLVALLFEPSDTSGLKGGTQSAHTCGGDADLVWVLHRVTDLKSQ